jgi:hypothetical protein
LGAGVETVFDEFFNGAGRAFDDFARRDEANEGFGKFLDLPQVVKPLL